MMREREFRDDERKEADKFYSWFSFYAKGKTEKKTEKKTSNRKTL